MGEESSPMTNPTPVPAESTDQEPRRQPQAQTAVDLLRAWREGDEKEQRETLAYLIHALDADRLSDRKLFPS